MRIVLDTNVIVSGFISPLGTCGEILRATSSGSLILCVDGRVLREYEDVLRRGHFGFDKDRVDAYLARMETVTEVVLGSSLPFILPDQSDSPFLEVAVAARADYLVTGNARHFPVELRCGVRVLSPAEFVKVMRSGDPRAESPTRK